VSYLLNNLNLINPCWAVFARVLAAIFGGYALATSSALFIGQLLSSSAGKYQAIHIGLLLSFIVYACAAMWVFSLSNATKAWIGLIKWNLSLCIRHLAINAVSGASH